MDEEQRKAAHAALDDALLKVAIVWSGRTGPGGPCTRVLCVNVSGGARNRTCWKCVAGSTCKGSVGSSSCSRGTFPPTLLGISIARRAPTAEAFAKPTEKKEEEEDDDEDMVVAPGDSLADLLADDEPAPTARPWPGAPATGPGEWCLATARVFSPTSERFPQW